MTLWRILFSFEGRIGRGVFWFAMLAVLMLDLAVASVTSDWIHAAYLDTGVPSRPGGAMVGAGFGLLAVAAPSVWAGLGLAVKRAHDIGRSGWWVAIGLIPILGAVVLLAALGLRAGSSRRNRFGDPPGVVQDYALDQAPAAEAVPLKRPFSEPEAAPLSVIEPEPIFDPEPEPDVRAEPPHGPEGPDVIASAPESLPQQRPNGEAPPASPPEAPPAASFHPGKPLPVLSDAAWVPAPSAVALPEASPSTFRAANDPYV